MTTTYFNPVDEWVALCFPSAGDLGFITQTPEPAVNHHYRKVGEVNGVNSYDGTELHWPVGAPWPASVEERRHALTHIACQGNFLQVKDMEGCKVCFPDPAEEWATSIPTESMVMDEASLVEAAKKLDEDS